MENCKNLYLRAHLDEVPPPHILDNMKKKILSYYAVFEPAEEGGYNVSFPSFPGCVTFGRTFEEAKRKAQEVLELWLEELRADREKIPTPAHYPLIDQIRVALPIGK